MSVLRIPAEALRRLFLLGGGRKRGGVVVEEGLIPVRLPDGRVIYAKQVIRVDGATVTFIDASGQLRTVAFSPHGVEER